MTSKPGFSCPPPLKRTPTKRPQLTDISRTLIYIHVTGIKFLGKNFWEVLSFKNVGRGSCWILSMYKYKLFESDQDKYRLRLKV